MKVLLKDTVSFQGREAKAGEILDLPERSAKSLITAELAADVPEQPLRLPDPGDNDLGGSKLPDDDLKGHENEVARLTKALDDQYKRDELAGAAKTSGVEFPYNAKKDEIIAAAIAQGKATTLLK